MRTAQLAPAAIAALIFTTWSLPFTAEGGSVRDGYQWLSENDEILREGIVWNDRLGDGKDRYKSGGLTHGLVIPEQRISESQWIEGHHSALELQARGFVVTPDNTTNGPAIGDRPFAQYASVGAFLRTIEEPVPYGRGRSSSTENRVGIEFGYQGDPLPFFRLQDLIHGGDLYRTPSMSLAGEMLVNLEVRRTWRFHQQLRDTDLELAPYVKASAGMRENSVRVGGDFIYGSSLEGRLWNIDSAVGALIPGGSSPRSGANWLLWVGADVGYVASDAFLDGGFSRDGLSVPREELTGRVRAGLMLEYDDFAVAYSVTWLSEEFETQDDGQVIGALTFKYRF